jgi:hypothetical protein
MSQRWEASISLLVCHLNYTNYDKREQVKYGQVGSYNFGGPGCLGRHEL